MQLKKRERVVGWCGVADVLHQDDPVGVDGHQRKTQQQGAGRHRTRRE